MNLRIADRYRSYALGVKVLGIERSLARFLEQLDQKLPPDASILDVACGTGMIGLTLIARCPRGTLVATDLNRDLLEAARQNALEHGVNGHRLMLGVSDISQPDVVAPLNGTSNSVTLEQFDVVATGAAIGYSRDREHTIETLLKMVKPGGCFLNIEMNETFIGKATSRRYHYPQLTHAQLDRVAAREGFVVTEVPIRTFPARLTRTCYIARRNKM